MYQNTLEDRVSRLTPSALTVSIVCANALLGAHVEHLNARLGTSEIAAPVLSSADLLHTCSRLVADGQRALVAVVLALSLDSYVEEQSHATR